MRYQNEIVERLKVLAINVNYFESVGWWHFKYRSYQMLYIPANDSSNTIRICIPHFDSVKRNEAKSLVAVINETNREVKYVKVVILGNGSISINYDHKYNGENDVYSMVSHMLKTLCYAAEYLKNKLIEKYFHFVGYFPSILFIKAKR